MSKSLLKKTEQNDEIHASDVVSEVESNRIQLFEKLKIFPILDTYESILKFFRNFCVIQFLTILVLIGSSVYYYSELYSVNKQLIRESQRVSQYLYEQEILNLRTFGARIAADYFSISHYNGERIRSNLLAYLHPTAVPKITQQLDDVIMLASKGQIVQYPAKIDYGRITITADRIVDGQKVYFVQVPVTIAIRKVKKDTSQTYSSTLGLYVLRGEVSLTNPYGFWILQMGPLQEK